MSDERRRRRTYNDEDVERGVREHERRDRDRREKQRQKRHATLKRKKAVSTLFLCLLLFCILLLLTRTPLFQIRHLTVEGNERVSKEAIVTASGMAQEDNIFKQSAKRSEQAIYALPYISEVSVKKRYPSSVKITVHEEGPVACFVFANRLVSVDKHGKTIEQPESDEADGLLRITGCEEGSYKMGGDIVLTSQEKAEISKRCLACIDEYDLVGIDEMDLSDEENVVFIFEGTLKVKLGTLGNDDELSYKMAAVKEALGKLGTMSGVLDARHAQTGIYYRPSENVYLSEPEEKNIDLTESDKESEEALQE